MLNFTLRNTELLEEVGLNRQYGYDGDRLLAYGNETFVYDILGNPTVYRNKALVWEKGRQLKQYGAVTFEYDGRGQRIKKNTTLYCYDSNGNLLKQSDGTNTLKFLYDNNGVMGVEYGGETYIYRRNVQGDITALLDSSGKVVVKYIYDAWGNQKVFDAQGNDITYKENDEQTEQYKDYMGNLNPFRYRGYYYDTETGLYFLKTRYYDAQVGRFINEDSINFVAFNINGLNLYAYCKNNPIKYVDRNGTRPEVSGQIDIGSLSKLEGYVWYSGRYKPKRTYLMDFRNPFKYIGNNLIYAGEVFLSALDLRAISWTADAFSLTSESFTFVSLGVDFLDGRFNVSDTDYIGIKLGTLKLDICDIAWGQEGFKFTLLDAQATLVTVGAYSQYVDAEFLLGSVGATIKWDDGELTIGASLGIGFKITIRLW